MSDEKNSSKWTQNLSDEVSPQYAAKIASAAQDELERNRENYRRSRYGLLQLIRDYWMQITCLSAFAGFGALFFNRLGSSISPQDDLLLTLESSESDDFDSIAALISGDWEMGEGLDEDWVDAWDGEV